MVLAVHPHGRGERAERQAAIDEAYGSSPRSWGTRGIGSIINTLKRFIPTVVGNAIQALV